MVTTNIETLFDFKVRYDGLNRGERLLIICKKVWLGKGQRSIFLDSKHHNQSIISCLESHD